MLFLLFPYIVGIRSYDKFLFDDCLLVIDWNVLYVIYWFMSFVDYIDTYSYNLKGTNVDVLNDNAILSNISTFLILLLSLLLYFELFLTSFSLTSFNIEYKSVSIFIYLFLLLFYKFSFIYSIVYCHFSTSYYTLALLYLFSFYPNPYGRNFLLLLLFSLIIFSLYLTLVGVFLNPI